ncbi:MAG: crossover junction endodeoxyribonuclease RuvC [Alistipes sp.]|nr:crossover junction endodeoxyribonuclease RuvC [Alistipes sp.]
MGIDPGTNYMGYGVIEIVDGRPHAVVIGEIDLHKIKDPYEKLRYIFERVRTLVEEYAPGEVAFESPFFGENVQSMLKLGRAQGVAIAAALSARVGITEYAPTRIKQAITGRGAATKEQVAQMINSILHTDYHPRKLDATDGMAVALCHFFTTSNPITRAMGGERKKGLGGDSKSRRGSSSWESFARSNPDRVKD